MPLIRVQMVAGAGTGAIQPYTLMPLAAQNLDHGPVQFQGRRDLGFQDVLNSCSQIVGHLASPGSPVRPYNFKLRAAVD